MEDPTIGMPYSVDDSSIGRPYRVEDPSHIVCVLLRFGEEK